jgi:hypothetical protein
MTEGIKMNWEELIAYLEAREQLEDLPGMIADLLED